ncbi:PTS transporter subunit EIIC [Holzapfeliella sp. JNUCC72]
MERKPSTNSTQKKLDFITKYSLKMVDSLKHLRWLLALKQTLDVLMIVALLGSMTILLQNFSNVFLSYFHLSFLKDFLFWLGPINQAIWVLTLPIYSFWFILVWSYFLALFYDNDAVLGSIIGVSSYLLASGFLNFNFKVTWQNLSTQNLFFAFFVSTIFVVIYNFMTKLQFQLSIMPGRFTWFYKKLSHLTSFLVTFSLMFIYFRETPKALHIALKEIFGGAQANLAMMSQNFIVVLVLLLLIQLYCYFNFQGNNLMITIVEFIYLTSQNFNIEAANYHQLPQYLMTKSTLDIYVFIGGVGSTLAFVLGVLFFSKIPERRRVAKYSLAPGIFNLNSSTLFGIPVILNKRYFVPFMITPIISLMTTYCALSLRWIDPVQVALPSIVPPFLNGFLATNLDLNSLVLILTNFLISLVIWTTYIKKENDDYKSAN